MTLNASLLRFSVWMKFVCDWSSLKLVWREIILYKTHKNIINLSCRVKTQISHNKNDVSLRPLFSFTACLKNGIHNRAAVIWTRATAGMNMSDESSYHEEGMLGNSTWAYSYYQQNYTLSPPLLPDRTSTSKPAACEQVHIAVEVWTVNYFKLISVFKYSVVLYVRFCFFQLTVEYYYTIPFNCHNNSF